MPTVTVLLLGVAAALGPPAARSDAGPFKPFDLTYLSRPGPCVVAARPGELVKHLGDGQKAVAEQVRRTLAAVFAFMDGDLRAAAPPALADIDELVFADRVTLGIETSKDGRSTLGADGICAGVVRTAKPFDWAAAARKWFPKAEPVKRAGRTYLRVPGAGPGDPAMLCLFAADGRTLSFDTDEERMAGLLDRLADKRSAPAPPGWAAVARDAVAVAHAPTGDDWLTAPAAPKREVDAALAALARRSTAVAVGFTPGERTALRVVATAADPADARKACDALRAFFATCAADDDTDPAAAKLLAAMAVTRDGTTATARGSAPGNLLRRLLGLDAEH